MTISGDELYAVVTNSKSPQEILDAINDFKAFVKKEFVDINQVPKYMEALCISVDHPISADVQVASFAVISHLVKRVSMQDHTGKVLNSQAFLVLPVILKRLGDPRASARSQSKRALEAYWFLAPQDVEMSIIEIALGSTNLMVIQELINWITHIFTNVSRLFKIDDFLHSLIRIIININDETIQNSIKDLFVLYYSSKPNQSSKHMLISELTKNRVSQRFCEQVLKEIEEKDNNNDNNNNSNSHINNNSNHNNHNNLPNHSPTAITNKVKSNFIASSGSTRITIPTAHSDENKFKKNPLPKAISSNNITHNKASSPDTSNINLPEISDPELLKIVSKYSNYKFEVLPLSVNVVDVSSTDSLYHTVSSFAPSFEGKETEFNWTAREKCIIQLRSIIRGNAVSEFREELVNCLADVSEPICKAVMSLRTTLSTHACQLIKECAMLLKASFDTLIEHFIPTLSKLCLATKHIASTNANVAMVSIYMNCSYLQKLVSKIQQSSIEKNFQPRSYCGIWLQILLHRFHKISHHSIETYTKTITKLLGDQNPTVRLVAKDTFWVFWSKYPSQGESLLPKLEGNIVRALERSRPKTNGLTDSQSLPDAAAPLTRKLSKPSIRESIIARNREIREKQRESRISSRPSSNMDIVSEDDRTLKPTALLKASTVRLGGGPKRNFTHDPTSSATLSTTSSNAKSRIASAGSLGDQKRDYSYQRSSFDVNADPIIKFLSSNQLEMKVEGINLLKFAILGEEELSSEIKVLVTNISKSNPLILKPLFLGSEDLLRKTFKYFMTSEDFIRVCCVLQENIDIKYVELIMSFVPLDAIYTSFSSILGYATKISSILNDSDLVMQMIKYKMMIFKVSLEFLSLALDKIPISDEIYSKLISSLFEMVTILRSTDLHELLLKLLSKFYIINGELFERCLHEASISIRDEIRHIMKTKEDEIIIDDDEDDDMLHQIQNLSVSYPTQLGSATSYDLTKVVYQPSSTIPSKGSPLKVLSDLTMLVPTFGSKNEFTFQESKRSSPTNSLDAEPQFDIVVEDNIDIDECEAKSLTKRGSFVDNMETDNPSSAEGDNVFVEQGLINESARSRKSDLFSKFNKENSTELVEDFAQVQIEELNDTSKLDNPIQLFIDKLDPLNKVSNKKKQIQIYQDESMQGSPQKQKEYNYSEMNWFNYLVARYRVDVSNSSLDSFSITKSDDALSVERFKSLCAKLGTNSLKGREFLELLNFLQERSYTPEISKYFDDQGSELLENSFWSFFENLQGTLDSSSSLSLFSGLLLLKQVLVNRSHINLVKLWGILFNLADYPSGTGKIESNKDSETNVHELENISNEVTIAIGEIFDEILVGSFSTQEILGLFMSVLQSIDQMRYKQLVFVLDSFCKLLNINTIGFSLSDQVINHIDQSLSKFLTSDSVAVRRSVVLIYGKLLKANISLEVSKMDNSEEKDVMDKILQRIPIPQKKLIEYYAQS